MLDFEEKNKSWLTSFLFRQELLKSCWLLQFLRFFLKMKSAILISLNIYQELCTTWCNSIPLPFTSFKRAIKQVITSLLCRGFFSILYIHLWWYFLSQSVSGMFANIHVLFFSNCVHPPPQEENTSPLNQNRKKGDQGIRSLWARKTLPIKKRFTKLQFSIILAVRRH